MEEVIDYYNLFYKNYSYPEIDKVLPQSTDYLENTTSMPIS